MQPGSVFNLRAVSLKNRFLERRKNLNETINCKNLLLKLISSIKCNPSAVWSHFIKLLCVSGTRIFWSFFVLILSLNWRYRNKNTYFFINNYFPFYWDFQYDICSLEIKFLSLLEWQLYNRRVLWLPKLGHKYNSNIPTLQRRSLNS